MSSTESFKLSKHTPLHENEQNECEILQWRLLRVNLLPMKWHKMLTFRITSSGKMIVLMYSNSPILVKISFIGLDRDFFSIAQIPTTTWKVNWVLIEYQTRPVLKWFQDDGTKNVPICTRGPPPQGAFCLGLCASFEGHFFAEQG